MFRTIKEQLLNVLYILQSPVSILRATAFTFVYLQSIKVVLQKQYSALLNSRLLSVITRQTSTFCRTYISEQYRWKLIIFITILIIAFITTEHHHAAPKSAVESFVRTLVPDYHIVLFYDPDLLLLYLGKLVNLLFLWSHDSNARNFHFFTKHTQSQGTTTTFRCAPHTTTMFYLTLLTFFNYNLVF